TRLIEELSTTTADDTALVIAARCYETEEILPFGPWVEMLRAADRDVLESLDPVWRVELARLLPDLATAELEPAAPPNDYLRLFSAIARAITAMAAGRLLILIVEDLHWADEMSVRLLGFLARRVTSWPCLLVGTIRVEELSEASMLHRLLAELRAEGRVESLSL